jgi:hypothetical protein
MVALFADNADLIFEGIPVGPFHGKAAIAAVYQEQPPDDEILLLDVREVPPQVRAAYAWKQAPSQHAGEMVLTADETGITRLVVRYGLASE